MLKTAAILAVSLMSVVLALPAHAQSSAYPICGGGKRVTCVVDGDTFWRSGEKFRIKDIDAPEVTEPRCDIERRAGNAATRRLAELLNSGKVTVRRSGRDVYGRTLAQVSVDGVDIGKVLVAEGQAQQWRGRKAQWC